VKLYAFYTLPSRYSRFVPVEKAAANHWIGGRVDLRVSLNIVAKRKIILLPGIEPRPSSLRACILRYAFQSYTYTFPFGICIIINIMLTDK